MPLEILCVEDDDITARLLSQVLRKAGFNVRQARNGAIALDMLTNRATDPKLIIMDVNMPEMDGFELCGQLQEDKRFVHIPVVFLTSRVTEGDRFRAFQAGAMDFISKLMMGSGVRGQKT